MSFVDTSFLFVEDQIMKKPDGGSIIIINDTYSLYEDETVTVSVGTYSKTAVIEDGTATIKGFTETGTVTVSVSDFTKTFNIDKYSKYEVGVGSVGGFYEQWLDSIDESSASYSSLEDVLADEKMVRELFTRHASVDFLVDSVGNYPEELETIIDNDYCAKWINLRDYALDTLYANQLIASLMDQADKYFYGEWALISQVPTMTGNTAPYGVARASTVHDINYAYKAFDGDISTCWHSQSEYQNAWLSYQFPNSVCITAAKVIPRWTGNNCQLKTYKYQGSNDGSNWVDLTENLITIDEGSGIVGVSNFDEFTKNIDNYTYYRIFVIDNWVQGSIAIIELQLYEWAPRGNVPVMTSNTAPYGTVSAYQVFDGNPSTTANGTDFSYQATNPICVRDFICKNTSNVDITGGTLQGSNDGGTWTSITMPSENTSYYLYHRVHFGSSHTVARVQFYGRELRVSVPKMTSNTALWGEMLQIGVVQSSFLYCLFDHSTSEYSTVGTGSTSQGDMAFGYKFDTPVVAKSMIVYLGSFISKWVDNRSSVIFKIRASNDGLNWVDVSDSITGMPTGYSSYEIDVNQSYKYYIIYTRNGNALSSSGDGRKIIFAMHELQFYGLDYSEYDWDTDNPRHYIYDHGVELEDLTLIGSVSRNSDCLKLIAANDQASKILDITDYTLLRGVVGSNASGTNVLLCGSGSATFTADYMPYNQSLDVSSINSTNATGVKQTATGTFDAAEIWLE